MGHLTVVKYDGSNLGRIYLGDVGRRRQLGGAANGIRTLGQDRYITWGQDATFMQTGEVLMSAASSTVSGYGVTGVHSGDTTYSIKPGVIRTYVNKGAFHVTLDA
jgi:hypothetical protein